VKCAAALLLLTGAAQAAERCPSQTGVVCSELVSRFDGARDRIYVRVPERVQGGAPVHLLLWFKAYGQGDDAVGDAAFHQLADQLGVITVGLRQRGIRNFLGDSYSSKNRLSEAERLAAKYDVAEVIDQIAARYRVGQVIVAGTSMGGYVALRLAQLFPDRVAGVIAAVPALCSGATGAPPECPGSFIGSGSRQIFAAAAGGAYDDKLVWMVAAGAETTPGVLPAQRELARILAGKPWVHYREIAGGDHHNYLADGGWFTLPGLRADLAAFLAAHPGEAPLPGPGWSPPANERRHYLVPELRATGLERAAVPGDFVPLALERDAWELGKSGPLWRRPPARAWGILRWGAIASLAAVLLALGLCWLWRRGRRRRRVG